MSEGAASNERITSFDEWYKGVPPWDIGHVQPVFVCLSQAHEINGAVLDVGCGTGENALYLAGLGHEVWGVDSAPTAIEKARAKARERRLNATFRVADALQLKSLDRQFDTVIDSGLFHVFSDEERPRFAAGLAMVLRPGGTYFVLCFCDRQPGQEGPRRVKRSEIRATFRGDWRVNYIREAAFETNLPPGTARAWLASITRK